ncbi:hypothetical protein GOODEAATRI_000486 [Goodea atripinnis]|uniref:Uncharacterized protein n=1 Tax=Goodea atripinnis TaxID=208336 RepID=A0ABV0NIT5_9TELE
MTAPVLVKVPEETKLWEPAVYTLSFLLPAANQDKPPAPTNDKDPTTTNTSGPASVNPSLELEHDAGVWNITTSSSVDTQADPTTEVQDDVH